MIREIAPRDGMTHIYDDTHTLIVAEPGHVRLHHKLCGNLLVLIPRVDLDMRAALASFVPCTCRKTAASEQQEATIVRRIKNEVYAHLYRSIQATGCLTAEDVLRLIERYSGATRQETKP